MSGVLGLFILRWWHGKAALGCLFHSDPLGSAWLYWRRWAGVCYKLSAVNLRMQTEDGIFRWWTFFSTRFIYLYMLWIFFIYVWEKLRVSGNKKHTLSRAWELRHRRPTAREFIIPMIYSLAIYKLLDYKIYLKIARTNYVVVVVAINIALKWSNKQCASCFSLLLNRVRIRTAVILYRLYRRTFCFRCIHVIYTANTILRETYFYYSRNRGVLAFY